MKPAESMHSIDDIMDVIASPVNVVIPFKNVDNKDAQIIPID